MPPPLDNQRCRERYEKGPYGQVMACPPNLKLPTVTEGTPFPPGASEEIAGRHLWAIDAIFFDRDMGAFAAEYGTQMRRYLAPRLAIDAMNQWELEGNMVDTFDYFKRGDLMYAHWLAAYKCMKWAKVLKAIESEHRVAAR